MSWTAGELASRCGGRLAGDAATRVEGVSTDTRSLTRGALFVAIRGEQFDGHDFAAEAVAKGAAALLLSRVVPAAAGAPAITVGDTIEALGLLACAERQRFAGPVIAITGSNGKTTTKEMCADVLAAAGLRVRRTPGSLNNSIGLPLSILALEHEDDALVVELGMNHPGEIDALAQVAAPDVGAITLIAATHLGPVGSIEAIARAKGELFDRIRPGGTAVVNADDARVVEQSARFAGHQLRYGEAAGNDFRASEVRALRDSTRFVLTTAEGSVRVRLPAPGRHLVTNALCAAACAVATGRLGPRPLAPIAAGLAAFRGAKQRLALRSAARGITLLDDTYNSSPASAAAALRTLRDVAGRGRTLAALADMLELGDEAPALHAEVGRAVAAAEVDVLVCVGELSAHTAAAARAAGVREVHEAPDAVAAGALLASAAQSGDTILVKGSRAMRMERALGPLLETEP